MFINNDLTMYISRSKILIDKIPILSKYTYTVVDGWPICYCGEREVWQAPFSFYVLFKGMIL